MWSGGGKPVSRKGWSFILAPRAVAVGVPFAWVTGDTVYGNDRKLRRWLEEQSLPYALRPAIGTALHHVLHPMGRCHARAGEAVASLLSGRLVLLRWRLAAAVAAPWQSCPDHPLVGMETAAPALRPGIRGGGPSGFARPRVQFGNPPLHPMGRCHAALQNGGLQLGNDGDEEIAVGGGQVTLSIHSLYMT